MPRIPERKSELWLKFQELGIRLGPLADDCGISFGTLRNILGTGSYSRNQGGILVRDRIALAIGLSRKISQISSVLVLLLGESNVSSREEER